jgi:hypothetical protein
MTTITCIHPITQQNLSFPIIDTMETDVDRRSFHPVCLFQDGTFDHEDWFYRFLDNYNGPLVARYDLFAENQEFTSRIADVVLMSFEQWKQHTTRSESFQTFEDLVEFFFHTEMDTD